MEKRNKKMAVLIAIIVAILSFSLLLLGIKYILGASIMLQNIIAFITVGIIVGAISFGLFLLRQKVSFVVFLFSLVSGFVFMFNTFNKDMDGWGDLAGLLSFFMFSLLGLTLALIIQLVAYLINRYKKHISPKD